MKTDKNRAAECWSSSLKINCMLFFLVFAVSVAKAQIGFDTLAQQMQKEKKYIVMSVGTKSCVYCLMQEKKMRKDEALKKRLADEVYYLSWKQDEQHNFWFNNREYTTGEQFTDQYGKDEKGFIAFPLWMIFDPEYKVIYRYTGLLSPEKIEKILNAIRSENQ